MKCLFLAPLRYPFVHSIASGLLSQGFKVQSVDYEDFFSTTTNRFVNSSKSLPRRVRSLWESPHERSVNLRYLEIFDRFSPDLVFIYNNQLVLPDVVERFAEKARIAFMLGDNPLYTPTSIYNLHILFHADYIITPDSLWRDQLTRLGIRNVVFDCFGYAPEDGSAAEPTSLERREHGSDFVYVGSGSKTNWGYKRITFLNLFSSFNLRAYISGGGLERWFHLYPDVESKIIPHDRFDAGFNNVVYRCSKIAPVDLVPSLFNGIHVRVFDALKAGILPLCEQSADLERVFDGIELPLIRDYREAQEIARHWLENGEARLECIRLMRARVEEHYTPSIVIKRMKEELFK